MRLTTIVGSPARVVAMIGDDALDLAAARVLDLAPPGWPSASLKALLEAGPDALLVARRVVDAVASGPDSQRERLRAEGLLFTLDDTAVLTPIPEPTLIVSTGGTYGSHLKEMKVPAPKHPGGFIKNSRSLVGHRAPIVLPPVASSMVDYEAEFSFVFGRPAYNVSEDEALGCVVGYLCGNDVSARDWAPAAIKWMNRQFEGPNPAALNTLYKQFPTFFPVGPVLVTADEVGDPHDLYVRCYVNGELRQDNHTSDLIFTIPQMIAHWSQYFGFQPGDIMTTGSGAGVGFAREPQSFLKPGDEVVVDVEKVGRLVNPVVAFE